MLLNSEVLFHRLEKDDMAKKKDRAGLDFNKLSSDSFTNFVLSCDPKPVSWYPLSFLFFFFFFGLEVGDGWSGKKVFLPCIGNIIYAGGVWMYILWCFWYQFVWVLFWSSVMKLYVIVSSQQLYFYHAPCFGICGVLFHDTHQNSFLFVEKFL